MGSLHGQMSCRSMLVIERRRWRACGEAQNPVVGNEERALHCSFASSSLRCLGDPTPGKSARRVHELYVRVLAASRSAHLYVCVTELAHRSHGRALRQGGSVSHASCRARESSKAQRASVSRGRHHGETRLRRSDGSPHTSEFVALVLVECPVLRFSILCQVVEGTLLRCIARVVRRTLSLCSCVCVCACGPVCAFGLLVQCCSFAAGLG